MRRFKIICMVLVITISMIGCDNILTMPLRKLFSRERIIYPLYTQEYGQFGGAVDISNNNAIIGAWTEDIVGDMAGAAYILQRDSIGIWQNTALLLASNPSDEDFFGNSVAIDSDYAFIGASKAALEALTRYLAIDLAPRGISVNCVSGGAVETDSLKAYAEEAEKRGFSVRQTPAGRPVKPEDIAEVVAFLCSEAAAMIRGRVIIVDGGLSLQL